jgi:acetyltransferase-like isoleucine patch superfamily enzyme
MGRVFDWSGFARLGDVRKIAVLAISSALPEHGGNATRTMLLRRLGLSIGAGTVLGGSVRITGPGDVRRSLSIGELCSIGGHLYIDLSAPVRIGKNVGIGLGATLITGDHDIGASDRRLGPLRGRPITIEDGAWLAARVTVLPGVRIGRGAVVGAGSVVTRDVEDDTLVAGVPAKTKKRYTSQAPAAHAQERPARASVPPAAGDARDRVVAHSPERP